MFCDDDINGDGVIDQNDVVTEQYSLQVETASFNYVTCSSSSKSWLIQIKYLDKFITTNNN